MFGYIKPYKPEMKIKEYENYKAVYCGLCNALGDNYGLVARSTLTYDMTFLAMLRMGISQMPPSCESFRCALNPLKKKCASVKNDSIDFASDAGVFLFYHSVKDKIRDPGIKNKLLGIIILPFAKFYRRKALKRNSKLEDGILKGLDKLSKCEKEKIASIDEAAAAFGEILQSIMSCGIDDIKDAAALRRAGFFLGRFIYIIDAFDDLAKDFKQKAYNPIILMWSKDGMKADDIKKAALEEIAFTLTLSLHEALLAIQLLTFTSFSEIILNVMELGLPMVQKNILYKEEKTLNEGLL